LKKNKIIYRIFIIAVFILVNAAVIYGISQVIAYLNTGADSSKILHLDIARTDYYLPEVTWVSIDNPGRPLAHENQKKIEQDYLDAWFVKNLALENNNTDGIYDHYTKSAREKVNALIAFNTAQKIAVRSTILNHHITLDFYSADGTVAIITDRRVSGIEKIYKNNKFITQREFNEDYRVILLLEDGFWRIRHFEKLAINEIAAAINSIPVGINQIKGLNYYPEKYPWDTFNRNVTSKTFAADFKIIKELDLNTIRVFIGYSDFGKAHVNVNKLEKLSILLDEAQKANLKVMITLFDFYGNYDIKNWTLTNQHLKAVVMKVSDHPALLAWDIKNEPNLDFENRDKKRVLSWLSQTIKALKQIDSIHPVTIGWSSHKAALTLKNEVDFISYHYYQNLEDLSKVHNSLKQETSKPVLLQEIGLSSYDGFWSFGGKDKEDQASFYTALLKIQKRDSINYLFWTLYDFDKIPNDVAGSLPWRKNKQAYFGIIDAAGVKPAYTSLKNN
jgi:hypothetical protein